MNCDDFLPSMETGGLVRRMRARRHAARCRRCAAVYAAFVSATQQWASPEPLSPCARHLWEQAAGELAVGPFRWRRWMPLAAGLAAACVVLLAVAMVLRKGFIAPPPREVAPRPSEVPAAPIPQRLAGDVIEQLDPAEELSRLAAAARQLDAQLQRLRHEAERIDAQRQLAVTLDRFGRW